MNDVEYRAVPEDRRDEFDRILGYAFRPEEGPPDPDDPEQEDDDTQDEDTEIGDRRGMFAGEDLLAVCRQLYWDAEVRGSAVTLAGLSAVGSPPESRRKGIVRQLVSESIAEYRDRGCEFGALWPFKRSFYERYGYATANRRAFLECPVEALSFADDTSDGEFRRVSADDWEALDRVYRRHSERFSLAIDRDERWWRQRVFRSWGSDPYAYCYERDGEAVGYVIYTIEEDDDAREFETREMAWTDPDAFDGLLRFAYYHDSQVDTVTLGTHPGSPLGDVLDRMDDPDFDDVTYQVWPGPMVRIVDVPQALEAIEYQDGVSDRLAFSVSDPVAENNDGQFVLDVAEGTARCRPADGNPATDADVECSIGALSQLAVGYKPVGRICRTADIRVEEDAMDSLGALFPADATYLRDFF